MSEPIVLSGPVNPSQLAEWLAPEARELALLLPGLRGTSLTNLARGFLEAGRNVEVVTLAPEVSEPLLLEGAMLRLLIGPYRPRPRDRCLDVFRLERRSVRKLLAATSGRVINAHWAYEFALGAAGFENRPLVVTLHDAPLGVFRRRPSVYLSVRTAMAAAVRFRRGALTAVSEYTAAAWRRQMLDRRPIAIIPNLVSIPALGAKTKRGRPRPVILEVAAAGRLKNVAALVRAMPAILSAHPAARLTLVGPGLTPDSDLGGLADRLGVAASIEFRGVLDQAALDPLFRRATVFAHASLEESQAMSISEAMAYGLPVIGGERAGGVPAQLDGGRAGLLVDTSRPEEIAAAVSQILSDPALAGQLGGAARKRAVERFSAAAVTASYLEVYERAASVR